jgi:hypothetical protein
MSDDVIANLRHSAAVMGMLMLCMQDFAAQIIKHVASGNPLDQGGLEKIMKTTVARMKMTDLQGTDISQSAAIFKQANEGLRALMIGAIDIANKTD